MIGLCPLLRIASGGNAENYITAARKGIIGHIAQPVRQINRRQTGTTTEGIAIDRLYHLRQNQFLQAGVAVEGRAADGGQFAAILKDHRRQAGAAEERKVRQIGDARRDLHRADGLPVSGPSHRTSVGGVRQTASTLDTQGVAGRNQARSKYGAKRPKAGAAKK